MAAPTDTAHGVVSAAALRAPAHWRRVDFIADLHLQASDGATFAAWRDFMQGTRADAVFILGDLFEVWVGDDALGDCVRPGVAVDPACEPHFAATCAQVLEAASRRLAVYFMRGNRDFLLGTSYAAACGMTLLDDPSVLDFAGQRWLLSHGDALCLEDTDYMQFREQVRGVQWRQTFLARPLEERQLIGRELRKQSETRKKRDLAGGVRVVDLDPDTTRDWLRAAEASTLIHGHTHKPAEHDLGNGQRRLVLSDWDGNASPVRASVLRLNAVHPDQAGDSAIIERLAATSA